MFYGTYRKFCSSPFQVATKQIWPPRLLYLEELMSPRRSTCWKLSHSSQIHDFKAWKRHPIIWYSTSSYRNHCSLRLARLGRGLNIMKNDNYSSVKPLIKHAVFELNKQIVAFGNMNSVFKHFGPIANAKIIHDYCFFSTTIQYRDFRYRWGFNLSCWTWSGQEY